MNIIKGDLLQLAADGRFDVIVHGCNCQCRMRRGIALSVSERFPAARDADLATEPGSRDKLGRYSQARVSENGHTFVVVNAYTQFDWRGKGVLADYDAIERAMGAIAREFHGLRIGYPLIGAGLARGEWSRISAIIDEALDGQDHTLVEFTG